MIHRAKEYPNPYKNQESGTCPDPTPRVPGLQVVPGWMIPVFPPSSPKSQCPTLQTEPSLGTSSNWSMEFPSGFLKPAAWISKITPAWPSTPCAHRALKPNKQPRRGKQTLGTTRVRKTRHCLDLNRVEWPDQFPRAFQGCQEFTECPCVSGWQGHGAVILHPSPPGPGLAVVSPEHPQENVTLGFPDKIPLFFIPNWSLYFWFGSGASPALFLPSNSSRENILPGLGISFPPLFLPPFSPLHCPHILKSPFLLQDPEFH